MENQYRTQSNDSGTFKYLSAFVIAVLLATLPFHYIWSAGKIFPKENLTFSNTFISQEDIDRLIERYNNASFLEKQAINQEPLVRKLMEQGVITETKNTTSEESYLPSEEPAPVYAEEEVTPSEEAAPVYEEEITPLEEPAPISEEDPINTPAI